MSWLLVAQLGGQSFQNYYEAEVITQIIRKHFFGVTDVRVIGK